MDVNSDRIYNYYITHDFNIYTTIQFKSETSSGHQGLIVTRNCWKLCIILKVFSFKFLTSVVDIYHFMWEEWSEIWLQTRLFFLLIHLSLTSRRAGLTLVLPLPYQKRHHSILHTQPLQNKGKGVKEIKDKFCCMKLNGEEIVPSTFKSVQEVLHLFSCPYVYQK